MAPSSNIPWLTKHDLFLLSQGGVVQVWECKRTISEAVLMKRNDFVYVDDVQDHLDLIKPTLTQWAEDDYKELVKYITERRLLVNGQGLVIAELPKFGLDGKMDASVSPLFMWSLDILALDTYLKHYTVQPIPFRPIQYLEDKNGSPGAAGRDVPVELSPNEHKLTKDLENENNEKKALETEVDDLKNNKKKGLEDDVAKLKDELTAKTNEADAAQRELDGMKKHLEEEEEGKVGGDLEAKIVQLTADLAEVRRQISELKQPLIQANNDKDAVDQRIVDLQNQLDIMINNNNKKPEFEPSWMNNYWESDWVDFYGLKEKAIYDVEPGHSPLVITREHTNYGEVNTTNVGRNFFNGARYREGIFQLKVEDLFFQVKVVDVARLIPNGYAKARFNPRIWGTLNNDGTLSAVRETHGAGTD